MKGTEKQIAWAENIKAEYMSMMEKMFEYLKRIQETGSTPDNVQDYFGACAFVAVYHPTATFEVVYNDMKASDLYKAFRSTENRTPERKAAGKAFRTAVASEAIRRLTEAVKEKAAEESAAKWIEERMR
jgi:hypothetical protein